MNHAEFVEEQVIILERVLEYAEKARREGLLALEESLDYDKIGERAIFEYGIRLVIDGTDKGIIEKILSNIIAQEKDEYSRLLKTIQKEAVLMIQEGLNPRLLFCLLNSYTDIPLNDEKMKKYVEGLMG